MQNDLGMLLRCKLRDSSGQGWGPHSAHLPGEGALLARGADTLSGKAVRFVTPFTSALGERLDDSDQLCKRNSAHTQKACITPRVAGIR